MIDNIPLALSTEESRLSIGTEGFGGLEQVGHLGLPGVGITFVDECA